MQQQEQQQQQPTPTTPQISELRSALFDAIAQLKAGTITVESARAVAELGSVIVQTAKVEVDFLRIVADPEYRRSEGTGFIQVTTGKPKAIEP